MLPFGLDISDAMIRLVVLSRTGHDWRMPIRAEIPVPEGLIVDGKIQHPDATADLLRELILATGTKLHQAILALPERHTFIKQFSVSAGPAHQLDDIVHAEATQHLPYTWEEVYHDWQVVGSPTDAGQQRILLAAAPRTLVDDYLNVLDLAKIDAVSLEIESVAIARATFPANDDGAHLLLDLGRTRSTIILVLHGLVLFSATIRYAGNELNRYIADTLHINLSQAERAKSVFGLDEQRGKGILKKVLVPQLQVLVEKIHDVLDFYQEHFPEHPPLQSIDLTGSGAVLRGIDTALSELLDRPVTIRPAWIYNQLHIADRQPAIELPYTYATAFGLALENFSS